MSINLPGATLKNIHRLRMFNLYTSLALTVLSSFTFMDQLMLRMDIDTRLFGSIKSMFYLLPAIAYQCMTPLLNRVRNDAKVCAWCYLLRCLIPSVLPLLPLLTRNHTVLTIACFTLPPIGMTLAAFANNTLMILYKRVIPEHNFNRQVGIMQMLASLPCSLMVMVVARIFDMVESSSDTVFFLTYLGATLVTISFELPAFLSVSKMQPTEKKSAGADKFKWRDMLKPYYDGKYRELLIMVFIRALCQGMLGAYTVVYMLQCRNYSMTLITTITTAMCIGCDLFAPSFGKLADRLGFANLLLPLAVCCLGGNILAAGNWCGGILLLVFAILTWDLNSSVCGRFMSYALYSACSRQTNQEYSSYYIGAFSLCGNGGSFIGSILGGIVYTAFYNYLGVEKMTNVYQWYFVICGIFTLLLLVSCTLYWRKNRGK